MQPMKLAKLIDENEIAEKVREMGVALTDKFHDQDVVVACVLNGSFMFYSDLIRNIDTDVVCDFLGVSSYGDSMKSSGEVKLTMDLSNSVKDRHVVLVEDIVDTGLTMNYLKDHIKAKGPKSITTASLLLKPNALKVECPLDHVGFEIANDFVVGYGLDYQGYYRNMPYIAQVQSMN